MSKDQNSEINDIRPAMHLNEAGGSFLTYQFIQSALCGIYLAGQDLPASDVTFFGAMMVVPPIITAALIARAHHKHSSTQQSHSPEAHPG